MFSRLFPQELTEEGLPFLILFHKPEDTEMVEKFTNAVTTQLLGEKSKFVQRFTGFYV